MGYEIVRPTKPPVQQQQEQQPTAQSQSQATVVKKNDPAPAGSTNAQYGMRDVSPEERNRTMTQEEYMRRIDDGELLFGPIPQFPTMAALDDIKFDFCDGLRLYIPKAKEGEKIKTYHVFIKEYEYNTVVCSAIKTNEKLEYITSIQKYFLKFELIVTRKSPLPEDMSARLISKYQINTRELAFIHEISQAPEIPFTTVEQGIFDKFEVYEKDKPRYAQCAKEV